MFIKKSLYKWAAEEDAKVFYNNIDDKGLALLKVPSKSIYLLALNEGDTGKWYLASRGGVMEFDKHDDAMNAFYDTYKKASKGSNNFNFVRKSSFKKVSKHIRKNASLNKKANNYSYADDPWIQDPEVLVAKASQELWALSGDSKSIGRLFNEDDFPLEV
jgi:hypothetical protein